ncbi:MAG: hypothetical protein IJ690_00215 [Clostridia bacterium]|nr:hypothetical protein [Clostridia bacterium]
MRHEEGKSSIKLIIAMIVIVILVILGVRYTIKFINSEKVKNFQYDMLLVKNKTEIYNAKHTLNKDENPLLGYQLTQLPEDININEFKDKHVISDEEYEKYYLLDSASLEKMDLSELANKYQGYFIVNYENYEVIYTEGYENKNGMWCYKISDLEKTQAEQKSQTNKIEETNEGEQNNGEGSQETSDISSEESIEN